MIRIYVTKFMNQTTKAPKSTDSAMGSRHGLLAVGGHVRPDAITSLATGRTELDACEGNTAR